MTDYDVVVASAVTGVNLVLLSKYNFLAAGDAENCFSAQMIHDCQIITVQQPECQNVAGQEQLLYLQLDEPDVVVQAVELFSASALTPVDWWLDYVLEDHSGGRICPHCSPASANDGHLHLAAHSPCSGLDSLAYGLKIMF